MTNPLIAQSLQKRRWAVVGATDDPARYGYRIVRQLLDAGYEVIPIHPTLKEIDGVPVFPSLREAPEVDVADFVVNPSIGLRVMEDVAARQVPIVWLQPGTRSEAIRSFAREHGIALVEDCILVRLGP